MKYEPMRKLVNLESLSVYLVTSQNNAEILDPIKIPTMNQIKSHLILKPSN